jgi:16S rRNA (uracil1498-N3)-methyltransferase
MVAAMKQSIKSRLPKIDDLMPFDKLVKQPFEGQKFIAWIDDDVKDCLCDLYHKGENALILIGPEGDFSPEEVALAKENGFVPCSLGDARLRTETAALVACHTVQLINQMK